MSGFENVRARFGANWTTVLVGWEGLGVFLPWPERWAELPPLLLLEEVVAYADERLGAASDPTEQSLAAALSMAKIQHESREEVRDQLAALSELDGGEAELERRKWRLVMLEQLLKGLSRDPVYGLVELTEFWQNWGLPPDSPHDIQGRGNAITPSEYYKSESFGRILARHRAWVEEETRSIDRHETQ